MKGLAIMAALGGIELAVQWTVLLYFVGLNGGYLLLNLVSIVQIRRTMQQRTTDSLPKLYDDASIPISVIVPAYNEQETIVASVRALLQLRYAQFEIVVVDDGSTDETLQRLIDGFELEPFPEAPRLRLRTERLGTVYRSRLHGNLRIATKQNGGKADSLNLGLDLAQCPLVCAVDADSVLQADSLERVVRPFLDDDRTVASGGTIRIANGCRIEKGFLSRIGLPRHPLALVQVVEYLRAFLFGRMGWSPLNAVLIVSGAFGLFRRDTVIEAGGYRTATIGEDMELIVRLHRTLRDRGEPYRITFIPDPICWTEAPEDVRTLARQRIRWQRGLLESLWANRSLMMRRRSGAVGWLAFPFFTIFEALGPAIELLGYAYFIIGALTGVLSAEAAAAFLAAALGIGMLLSVSALLLEEISFHIYPRPRHVLALVAVAVLENLGYRQLNAVWRMAGLIGWIFRRSPQWGEMRRAKGRLETAADPA